MLSQQKDRQHVLSRKKDSMCYHGKNKLACAITEKKTDSMFYHGKKTDGMCYHGNR